MTDTDITVGFIGQGFVGKSYADDFESRGYEVVRYALEKPYNENKETITNCDVVFIAVPTPTTPKGFDHSVVENVLSLVGKGKIAVIKSTVMPGTTEKLQEKFPNILVLNSPEFLSEATAAEDARNPFANIVGTPEDSEKYKKAAGLVHTILPEAPYSLTCKSKESEIIKYSHNGSGYIQVVFFNAMYDLAKSLGADWEPIQEAILADPMISNRYAKPLHKTGRGAGGNCFIKDFAVLRELYKESVKDEVGGKMFEAIEKKNKDLLTQSGKDADLLKDVYGE